MHRSRERIAPAGEGESTARRELRPNDPGLTRGHGKEPFGCRPRTGRRESHHDTGCDRGAKLARQEELHLRPEAAYRLLDVVRQNGWRLRPKRGEPITITAVRGDVVVRGTGVTVRAAASAIFGATTLCGLRVGAGRTRRQLPPEASRQAPSGRRRAPSSMSSPGGARPSGLEALRADLSEGEECPNGLVSPLRGG